MAQAQRVGRVCVVGSSNVDLIAYTDRLPLPGETVLGSHFSQGFGGKGANQAVQAARLGSHVVMVTKLGEDSYGASTRDNYAANSIDLSHVLSTPEVSSGLAPITVDKHGNNCIIVVPGANNLLSEQDVRDAASSIDSCAVLLCQNEVPLATTKEALRLGKEKGLTTIFNVAPAPPSLPDDVLQVVDILCLNETELALLASMACDNDEKLINAARALIRRGAGKVVVTLGGEGCFLVPSADDDAAQPVKIPAEKVDKVVDTVGAGDSFLGTLGHFLAAGKDLVAALQLANKVAAQSVQREGTQKSYPYRADLPAEWFHS